jgi:hypothetical protein
VSRGWRADWDVVDGGWCVSELGGAILKQPRVGDETGGMVALTCAVSRSLRLRGCRRESEIGGIWKATHPWIDVDLYDLTIFSIDIHHRRTYFSLALSCQVYMLVLYKRILTDPLPLKYIIVQSPYDGWKGTASPVEVFALASASWAFLLSSSLISSSASCSNLSSFSCASPLFFSRSSSFTILTT